MAGAVRDRLILLRTHPTSPFCFWTKGGLRSQQATKGVAHEGVLHPKGATGRSSGIATPSALWRPLDLLCVAVGQGRAVKLTWAELKLSR